MIEHEYSSESTQQELSNEYPHYRVTKVFKNPCVLVFWMKVASALERLSTSQSFRQCILGRTIAIGLVTSIKLSEQEEEKGWRRRKKKFIIVYHVELQNPLWLGAKRSKLDYVLKIDMHRAMMVYATQHTRWTLIYIYLNITSHSLQSMNVIIPSTSWVFTSPETYEIISIKEQYFKE